MRTPRQVWSDFFFAPFDLQAVALFRVLFATLYLTNFAILGCDLNFFFGPDGVMPLAISRTIIDPDSHTIFELLPDTHFVLWISFALAILHGLGLLFGYWPRLQALGAFVWLWWFQDRHVMIFDGEDHLFRLFAFFLIFLPTHQFYSFHAWLRERRAEPLPDNHGSAWAMRLVQIQITLVYIGAAIAKARGIEWRDGTAMWYVSRLDDSFGFFPLPDFLFNSLPLIHALTWGTLLIEHFIPIGLWIPKTRRLTLWVAVLFHVSLWYAMNLFLFHPLMLVGLLSFVALVPTDRARRSGNAMSAGSWKN